MKYLVQRASRLTPEIASAYWKLLGVGLEGYIVSWMLQTTFTVRQVCKKWKTICDHELGHVMKRSLFSLGLTDEEIKKKAFLTFGKYLASSMLDGLIQYVFVPIFSDRATDNDQSPDYHRVYLLDHDREHVLRIDTPTAGFTLGEMKQRTMLHKKLMETQIKELPQTCKLKMTFNHFTDNIQSHCLRTHLQQIVEREIISVVDRKKWIERLEQEGDDDILLLLFGPDNSHILNLNMNATQYRHSLMDAYSGCATLLIDLTPYYIYQLMSPRYKNKERYYSRLICSVARFESINRDINWRRTALGKIAGWVYNKIL